VTQKDWCTCERCVLRRRIEAAKKAAKDDQDCWALAALVDELFAELDSRKKEEMAR
jgi:hypothetical protein